MKNGFTAALPVVILVIALFASGYGCRVDTISPPLPSSVKHAAVFAVSPRDANLAPGSRVQLRALASSSGSSGQAAAAPVSWSSEDPSIASVDASGLVTAVAGSGTTTVTATAGTRTATARVTVSPLASVGVIPPNPSIAPGTTLQFRAIGTLQNSATQDLSDQAAWNSSDPGTATVPAGGLATAGALPGTATISATFSGMTGSTQLVTAEIASIDVTPESSSVVQGGSRQFSAKAVLSNNATQDVTNFATWTAAPQTVALISSTGFAVSLASGSALITAAFGGATGSAVLNVTSASLVSISVAPASSTITTAGTQQFSATGNFSDGTKRDITADAAWTSSNTSAATISIMPGTRGLAVPVGEGSTSITASFLGVTSNPASLVVTAATGTQPAGQPGLAILPSNPTVRAGDTIQFTAGTITANGTVATDLSATGTWNSSNPAVARVSQTGFTTTFTAGSTLITFTSGSSSVSTVLIVTF